MAKIFWDTNLFIYLFERIPPYVTQVRELRQKMLTRGDRLFTSTLTVGEVLVLPRREPEPELEQRYLSLFRNPTLSVVPFDLAAAPIYARIRRNRAIKPPDAIQLACASAAGIDLFITNDERLSQHAVSGIKFIVSLARIPF